jgi:hypothetical protein
VSGRLTRHLLDLSRESVLVWRCRGEDSSGRHDDCGCVSFLGSEAQVSLRVCDVSAF